MVIVENYIRNLSWHFINLYFIKSDYNQVLSYIDNQITWIDSKGKHINRIEDIKDMLGGEVCLNHSVIENCPCHIKELSKKTYIVDISIKIKTDDVDSHSSDMFISMIWRKYIDWKITHIQISGEYNFQNEKISKDLYVSNLYYQEINKKMKRAATFDQLTQIYNFHGFENEVHNLLNRNPKQQYAIIKFEVRNFRFINRKYGYKVGDEVLRNIANNLTKTLKDNEICGRVEKDTFIMLYKMKNKGDLEYRLNAIKGKLIDKNLIHKLNMDIQLIAGIYVLNNDTEDIRDMMDKALVAMRNVNKTVRGSQYLYYEDWMLNQQYQDTKVLEEAPQAMAHEEFELYIQPQFDIHTKEIVSGEVLVRWKLKDGTIRMPDQFIQLFEKNGMILSFDFYMLEHLCEIMREWIDNKTKVLPVSINQSRLHIVEMNYFKDFCSVIDKYKIPHELIIFEFTESAFVENKERMLGLAKQLHSNGFQLAIDDFGVGYASLSLLSVISADILKLDKTLLNNYDTNPKTKIIMQKTIEMAHQMGMLVVCEGIETEAQLKFVRKINCDIGQGYLISKPIESKMYFQQWVNKK